MQVNPKIKKLIEEITRLLEDPEIAKLIPELDKKIIGELRERYGVYKGETKLT